MQVMYQSTRGKGEPVTASQAILKGLSEDGGLFVPTQIPALDVSMDELSRMTYQETAYQVMSRLLTDFTEEELRTCINRAYDKKFDTDVIAPLKEADGAYYPTSKKRTSAEERPFCFAILFSIHMMIHTSPPLLSFTIFFIVS